VEQPGDRFPLDDRATYSAVLDLATGSAASGSPVLRVDTGEIIGVLVEGQIGKTASLSVARPIYQDGAIVRTRAGNIRIGSTEFVLPDDGTSPRHIVLKSAASVS
jgi:hypothetical protein